MKNTTTFIKKKNLLSALCAGVILLPALMSPLYAEESGIDSRDMNETKRQVPAEDVRDPEPPLTGRELIEASFPGSWPMFGEKTRMKIGGYVKADFIYDMDGTTDKNQFLLSTIPVEGTPEYADEGYVHLTSQETRFNIDVRRIESGKPPLRVYVEGDFWNDNSQFRLRHAYIVAGDFLIGQTWTTLTVLEALPFLIDFGAGDALFGGRTTLIRYQKSVNDSWKLAVGIENMDNMGIENPSGLDGNPSAGLPLLALRADYRWPSGMLVLGTSAAQLRWDGGATGPDAKALQWDVLVAGRQYIGPDNYVSWNLSYGDGSGENIMAFAGSDANAVLTPTGDLETMTSYAFVLGYMHKWNKEYSSNLSYAYGWLDTPESREADALKRGGIGHVNLIWRPVPKFSCGIEYMWGAKRTTDGSYGSARRIQSMARLEF